MLWIKNMLSCLFALDADWLAYNTRIISLFCFDSAEGGKRETTGGGRNCLLFMTICHRTSCAETRTVTLEGNSLKRFEKDLINSSLPLFYLCLERAGLCGFYMALCRIRCQTVVIKIGSEEDVVRQKAIFLGTHLCYSIIKRICSQFFQFFKASKSPSSHLLTRGEEKNQAKFHTLIIFFKLAHHFRGCSHYSQF